MRGCVSFQIKVKNLAFYTDMCTAHKRGGRNHQKSHKGITKIQKHHQGLLLLTVVGGYRDKHTTIKVHLGVITLSLIVISLSTISAPLQKRREKAYVYMSK